MSNDNPETDRQGRTPLHYAALQGDVIEVRNLIESGFEPDVADHQGFTPLHLAAQEWRVDAARALLDAGASVDAKNQFGNTPLFVAVFNSRGRKELIALLRERGADPFSENLHGNSPFDLAKKIANFDVRQHFADLDVAE
ncbi:MAG: ankyrin repeat domain-containing protein [Mycobacteriales bacterium]